MQIVQDMFRLWILAERDLLSEGNAYRLMNTGQVSLTCRALVAALDTQQRTLAHTPK